MRTLSAPLLAEQKKASRRPAVQVTIGDLFGGVRRLRPAAWYTGSEAAGPHAAVCPSDGSLNRFRVEAGTLYRQRVTTPGSGDTYSSWTSFRANTTQVACAAYANVIIVVCVDSVTPTQVHTAASADGGATWAAFSLAFTHAVTVTSLALAAKSDGNLLALMNNANNISARRWNGASWSAAVTTTDGTITPTGLACWHHGDWNVLATGTLVAGGDSVLRGLTHGDGYLQAANTWGSQTTILRQWPSSSIAYAAPYAARSDTARYTVRETFTGTGAYDRIAYSRAPATVDESRDLWQEPIPFNLDHDYGLALASNATHIFLTTPARVYASPLATATIDATADVLSVDMPEGPLGEEPTTVVISNARGTYDGPPDPITKGAEVRIAPGYKIDGVATYSTGPAVWIERIEQRFGADRRDATLTLICRPLGWWLARWRAPRVLKYSGANAFNILTDLFARVGFEFSGAGASAASTALQPLLVIPAGTSARDAVRLILDRLPDTVFNLGEFAYLNEPLAADAADEAYTYHGASHPITGANYITAVKRSAFVRVIGGTPANVIGEAIDYTEAQLAYSPSRSLADREATTALLAANRAAAIMRGYESDANDDVVIAAVHAGLEVNDVITLTDIRVGLSAAKRRVRRIRLRYQRRQPKRGGSPAQRGIYEHHITLGAP